MSELHVILCVAAHFGIGDPPEVDLTTQNVAELCDWTTLKQYVQVFVKQSSHCSATDETVLRVLETGYRVRSRTIDFTGTMCIGISITGQRYILVLKDDASKYVGLKDVAEADALNTRDVSHALFASFGICYR